MSIIDEAKEFRRRLEEAVQKLPNDLAVDYADMHPAWSGDSASYTQGQRVVYKGVLYQVLQAHVSQAGWAPDEAYSLFAKVLVSEDPDVVLPWEQPESTNPYRKGDRVIHNGHVWESLIDGNVWAPGVYGWQIVEQ